MAIDQHRILAPVTVSTQQAVAVNINCAINTIIVMHQFYDKLQRSRNFCTKTSFRSLFLTSILKKTARSNRTTPSKAHCFIKSFVKHSQKIPITDQIVTCEAQKAPCLLLLPSFRRFSFHSAIAATIDRFSGCNRSNALSVAVRVSLCQVVSRKTLEFYFRILRLIL